MDEKMPVIRIRGVRKEYRVGEIGGRTLQNDLKSWWARKHGREDPNLPIGAKARLRGERFLALDGIDLTVQPGEALGIIGPNGAGKSTLLKLICRITAPTEGTIELRGRVTSMLEVGTGFHGEMTGRENIYLNGAILGMTRQEIDRKLEDIIDFSEVREFIDTPVKRYSSGMYVKLAFSVAAHLDSEIIIMDEVLAVGDMAFQKKCLNRMREAAKVEGRTILYVSHNMNTIRHLCDRCIVLEEGRLRYDGDVDTAVNLYLGAETGHQTVYRYDAAYRPYDRSLRVQKRFEMKSLRMAGREAEFEAGQLQTFRLECEAYRPLEKVGFRLELWYQDGSKVGTMLSGGTVDLEPGTSLVDLRMDTTHLTGGHYSADLVAYTYDEDGTEDILDGVYPGLTFQIRDRLDEDNPLDWHHQYWGHIRLHDLTVEKT